MEVKKSVEGVRINPPVVEFHDVTPDALYQIQLTVQNFGKTSRRIRFHQPTSEVFQVHCKNPDKIIAAGLEVSALVEFCNNKEEDCSEMFIIMVDEDVVEIPLIAKVPQPAMEITGPVDFGTVVADGKVLRQEIQILNRGSKNGKFKLTYDGKEPLTMVPKQGVVKAGYSQPIRFEFISKSPGFLKETVQVSMEGEPATEVEVIANISKRSLKLLSMEDEEKVNHIAFGSTYYGTDVLRSCVLYNQSPDQVSFVVILEEEGEGQEIGVDLSLTKSTALSDLAWNQSNYEDRELTSLVTACPTQGTLGPYDKRLLHFKFSPRASKSSQGWSSTEMSQSRKDYAVFVHIDIVGNIGKLDGKATPTDSNDARVEVALTGTALPVFLSILPSPIISFENCPVGSKLDCEVTIRNDSPDLPVSFVVTKSAHFVPIPQSSKLNPNSHTDLLISFRPNQIGHFKPKMNLVALGYTVEIGGDFSSLPQFKQVAIFKYPLSVEGISLPVIGQKTAKSLSAQGRLYSQEPNETNVSLLKSGVGTSLKVFSSDDTNAGNARSKLTEIPFIKECKTGKVLPTTVAKPDDRAMSIRPSNKKERVITQFTKTERYTYVDPDYGYNDEEEKDRLAHRQIYIDYIQKLRKQKAEREKALEFKRLDNAVDLGMKPGRGLQPKKLTVKEINSQIPKEGKRSPNVKPERRLLTSKSVENVRLATAKKKASEGLKAVATTQTELLDCGRKLSPIELYQVAIEPKVIDFGDVCAKSLVSKKLKIANSLDHHVDIKAEIDCRELRQTSPLSQIVPPRTVAALEFIFESTVLGKFERSVSYTINGHHKGHVIVLAEVVTVALSISTDKVSLLPTPGLPPEAGMRKTITLENKRNMIAEFSWAPNVGKDGTAFSVRPARGAVNPNSSLECEVVFYPSFYAPLNGSFNLSVEGGNQLELRASAEIAPATCSFVEHRVMFGAVPLNLDTTRSASLKNTGQNHAFFKVVDSSPIAGMTITPKTGVVPVGGTAELVVNYKPISIQKFDTQIEVLVRGWKPIYLRMGGHVEAPCVDIDMDSFQFGGIYCGAKAVVPFTLRNLARSRANVAFDLSRQRDFTLRFENPDDTSHEIPDAEGCFHVSLFGQQEMPCFLEFNPVEVASYDFVIPAVINQTAAPTPPPSPYPASVAMSKGGNATEDFENIEARRVSQYPTPSRRVQATALRAPLQVSNTDIDFILPSGYYEMGIESVAGRAIGIMFVNNSNSRLSWFLDLEKGGPYIDDGTFQLLHRSGSPYQLSKENKNLTVPETFLVSGETAQLGILFSPSEPGIYEANIPIILNGDTEHPYRVFRLRGILESPSILFEPAAIHFTPVPLRTTTNLEFSLVAKGFRRATEVHCIIPEVELEDGSKLKVLNVSFPNGNIIQPCCQDAGEKEPFVLLCQISFHSPKPVSFATAVEFVTEQNSHYLPVIATADNCLLTCYKFLAMHQSDFHIVCEEIAQKDNSQQQEATGKHERITYGEAMFVPCVSAIKSPVENSNVTTSTSFGLTASTYPESSMSSSTARSPTDENKEEEEQDETSIPYEMYGTEDTADTDEEKYLKEVVRTIQRWFSSQAWASGPCPIQLPSSLRSGFGSGVNDGGTTRAGTWSREKKESRTIFDMVTHLCGKAVPGIPINASVPTEAYDRTRHLIWMYTTLLTFLRCQGAMTSSIQPEYLLDKADFKRFVVIRETEMAHAGVSFLSGSVQREQERYEVLSRHAWTDLLLQIVKVLILNRITPQQYRKIPLPGKGTPLPTLNVDPLSSNVFCVGERIILAWVNHHYEKQRTAGIWKSSISGNSPSSRWIVNFDNDFLDGLVLAALLAAHTPFIVPRFLSSMYTHPNTAEQCLHNCLKVVEAIRYLGMDYDILATDITEPNPVSMLMLCIYLYHRLPHYLPRSKIEFTGPLHANVTKQVKLQNPSSKPIIYQVIISGKHASDFSVPSGKTIKVPAKNHVQLPVEYRSRFLRSCHAVLILVGKRMGSQVGSTIVFNLATSVDAITPMATVKTESPCYELKKIELDVKNPFKKAADFRIILVEAKQSNPEVTPRTTKKVKQPGLKKVESKIDHGVKKKFVAKKAESVIDAQNATLKSEKDNTEASISAFFCPSKELHIEPYSSAKLELQFLPFTIGHRQCSVLFLNEDVGELVYSIEAEALLPLPSALPFQPSSRTVRVSSASAAEKSQGLFGGDDRVVYWQCNVNDQIAEEVVLPIINEAKEKALVLAAQQRMSEKELRRREITGSLSVATIANALQTMGLSSDSLATSSPSSVTSKSGTVGFVVEGNSKYFTMPKTFDMNVVTDTTSAQENARLPVAFIPDGPGHYQCRIVMKAPNDIRVYQIEVTTNPEGSDIELEFTSPTHESVTQNIPVVNSSERDWSLVASIEGEGFYGPENLFCPKLTSATYALTFQPMYEGVVQGHLKLKNTISGTETIFLLRGEGRKPLQLNHIELECEVEKGTQFKIKVPNVTGRKMVFQAFCDLDFVSGPPFVTVLPMQTATVLMTIKPWRRGLFDGVISFVSDEAVTLKLGLDKTIDSDSDEDDIPLPDSSRSSHHSKSIIQLPNLSTKCSMFTKPYRLWYSMKITSLPSPPMKTLEVECPCHERAAVEILVENPSNEKVEFEVFIEGRDLVAGDDWIVVHPKTSGIYQVDFAPTVIGRNRGSVIFQHPSVGEIWYELILIASSPPPRDLHLMQCPIGSKCHQMIRLDNPTDKPVVYSASCSNTHNFRFDLADHTIEIPAHSGIEVPLTFSPSALGLGRHTAEIVFKSDKLGDLVFNVNGSGQPPVQSDDHVIRSSIAGSSSTIISFENPFEEDILVNVDLQEKPPSKTDFIFSFITSGQQLQEQAFSLLLRQSENVVLAPKMKLDIPICFAPESMVRHEAICYVTATKTDGTSFETHGQITKFSYNREMRWLFPIRGIPESRPIKDSKAPRIECKARSRLEERLEISFTGLNQTLPDTSYTATHLRALSPNTLAENPTPYGLEYTALPENFKYDFEYGDTEAQIAVERSVGVNLVRKMSHKSSGFATLVFNLVFSPHKSFNHLVHLIITATSGGVWRFPLRFVAAEPDPDDVIQLEAVGLNKEVSVGFRLTSKSEKYVPFWIEMDSNGDQMFSVTPSSGELPPVNFSGQLFIVAYKPRYYGKTHTSKLIIHTSDMQWVYELRGVLPRYQPPLMMSSQEMEERQPSSYRGNKKTKNYVRDNLNLACTATSSPFKGSSLIKRGARTVPADLK